MVAPITRTIRQAPAEVRLGPSEGLRGESVADCHGLTTVRKSDLEPRAAGRLSEEKVRELDEALNYALEIRY
jgi:mRNA-degrading endonuclease toxin of MazEF toxin-antitoxin module